MQPRNSIESKMEHMRDKARKKTEVLVVWDGVTEHGRSCRETSLAACVETLAFIARKIASRCVTLQHARDSWYVYASQEDLDADTVDTETGRLASRWFASVTATEITKES